MTRVTELYTQPQKLLSVKTENKYAQNTSWLDAHKEGSVILWIQKT